MPDYLAKHPRVTATFYEKAAVVAAPSGANAAGRFEIPVPAQFYLVEYNTGFVTLSKEDFEALYQEGRSVRAYVD